MVEIFGPALRNGKENEGGQSEVDEKLIERGGAEGRHQLKTFREHAQKDQHENGQQQ